MTGKIVKSHCNRCVGIKNHDLLLERREEFADLDEDGAPAFSEYDEYEFLQCRGCGSYSMRNTYWNSGSYDDNGRIEKAISYFPAAISRRKPDWATNYKFWFVVPDAIRETLNEVYSALHGDMPRLAAMGIRTLIDIIITKKMGDVGSFRQKLDAFCSAGHISKSQQEIVSAAIDAGSASAHRGYKPSNDDLNALMDIVESVIASVYIHPIQGEQVRRMTPPRGQQ